MAQLRMKWKRKWAAAEQEEEGNEHDDDAEESLESGEESEPASQRGRKSALYLRSAFQLALFASVGR
ncbi:unnamed protein product [Sphagnum jensenii]|uniref:Uncharacterized protein n=1 Tax=Sphagnum jensenii TaxID=128206 RepID=A0ABP0VNU8_9BRYO